MEAAFRAAGWTGGEGVRLGLMLGLGLGLGLRLGLGVGLGVGLGWVGGRRRCTWLGFRLG